MTYRAARRASCFRGGSAMLGFARSGRALAAALVDARRRGGGRRQPARERLRRPRRARGRAACGSSSADRARGFLDGRGLARGLAGRAARRRRPCRRRARAGVAVLAEIEIAWRIAEAEAPGRNRWVAVTGTNGKSTTTAWIAEILAARRPARRARRATSARRSPAFLSRAPRRATSSASSPPSSSRRSTASAPHVAVLTNVTPDHLDRYAGLRGVRRREGAHLRAPAPGGLRGRQRGRPGRRARSRRAARRVALLAARPPAGAAARGSRTGELVSDVAAPRRAVVAAASLALPGAHNLENALAALAAADCLGRAAGRDRRAR